MWVASFYKVAQIKTIRETRSCEALYSNDFASLDWEPCFVELLQNEASRDRLQDRYVEVTLAYRCRVETFKVRLNRNYYGNQANLGLFLRGNPTR